MKQIVHQQPCHVWHSNVSHFHQEVERSKVCIIPSSSGNTFFTPEHAIVNWVPQGTSLHWVVCSFPRFSQSQLLFFSNTSLLIIVDRWCCIRAGAKRTSIRNLCPKRPVPARPCDYVGTQDVNLAKLGYGFYFSHILNKFWSTIPRLTATAYVSDAFTSDSEFSCSKGWASDQIDHMKSCYFFFVLLVSGPGISVSSFAIYQT